jgi:hypothetical protein
LAWLTLAILAFGAFATLTVIGVALLFLANRSR